MAIGPNNESGEGGIAVKRMRVDLVLDAVGSGAQRHVHFVTGAQARQHHGAAFLRISQ